MSSELLTRRMDLIHTLTQETGSSAPAVNHLTMDTSYPVKVKGIILKEYIATATLPNYPYSSWHKVKAIDLAGNESEKTYENIKFDFSDPEFTTVPTVTKDD